MSLSAVKGFDSDKAIGGGLAEAEQVTAEAMPDVAAAGAGETGGQIEGQGSVAGADEVLAELVLVRGEDADSTAAAGDADVPLLGICGGLDGGVRKQDVVHGFALGAVGGDRVAGLEFPKVGVQGPAVGQLNPSVSFHRFDRDQFAVGDFGASGQRPISLKVESVAVRDGDWAR